MPTLNTIRYHTENTPYHYTYDNLPLSDLEQNDIALNNALNVLTSNTTTVTAVGNWATLALTLDLHQDLGKPFMYKIRLWAIQDQSQLAAQSATILEDVVFGYNTLPGTVTALQVNNLFKQKVGSPTLTQTYTGSGNTLVISFSGYTGLGGYVMAKAERFGI